MVSLSILLCACHVKVGYKARTPYALPMRIMAYGGLAVLYTDSAALFALVSHFAVLVISSHAYDAGSYRLLPGC